jgi:hypothetical protein
MKVFQLKSDFKYQSFYPYDPRDPQAAELVKADILMRKGTPRLSSWNPPSIYVEKPELERGNFAHLWGFGGFVVDTHAREVLRSILEDTCELLPFLPHEEEVFHKMNVLKMVDCLDMERTKWRINKATGQKSFQIEEFHFSPERFSESTLFKLPKDPALLTITGLGDPKLEFKSIVEREGLTGLRFEELWSENGPPIKAKSLADRLRS